MKKSYDVVNTFIIGKNMSESSGVYAFPIVSDNDGVDRRYKWGDRPAIVRAATEAAKISSKSGGAAVQVWIFGSDDKPYDWRGEMVRHVLTLNNNAVTYMQRSIVRTRDCEEYEITVINNRDVELMRRDGLKLP